MVGLKLTAARVAALVGLLIAGVGVSAALATPGTTPNGGNPPSTVPGSPGDDCSHGNSGKDCRPDPNENGKDCEDHGNARGNEDHCDQATPTTTDTTTTTSTTTTTESTTSTTTQTTTTPTNTTPETRTTPSTTTTPATPAGSAPAENAPPTKPELQKELAEQVKGVQSGRVSPASSNPAELPFTGFPAWALALTGLLMLVAGLGLRKSVSDS
jgi:hypothetical protein